MDFLVAISDRKFKATTTIDDGFHVNAKMIEPGKRSVARENTSKYSVSTATITPRLPAFRFF